MILHLFVPSWDEATTIICIVLFGEYDSRNDPIASLKTLS